MPSDFPPAPVNTDVLIVGAGMAGLYSAWRLLRADPGRKIQIVEKLGRTGGRLQTDHVVIDGVPVQNEEGGMRFMTTQVELIALLSELRLTKDIVDFPMGGDANIYYLRGRRFTVGEARTDPAIWSSLYHLDEGSKGKQPGEILIDIRNAILIENGQDPATWASTPEHWTDFRLAYTYKGIETYKWGFWALLENYGLTNDCIEMLYDSSGFVAPYDQMVNAGCAFQLLADFVDPRFKHLVRGYSMLPEALVSEIQGSVPIHLQHTVRAIDQLPDGRLSATVQTPDGLRVFNCNELILGLTQQALRRLSPHVPFLRDNPRFLADMNSVVDMPLGKIDFYYDRNWWTPRYGITSGACFTDMALAQLYFFLQPDRPHDDQGPNSLTIYTDYYRTNFWSEAQKLGEPYQTEMFPTNPPHTVPASTYVVETALRQMRLLLGDDDIPAPVLTTYKRWTDPKMGDGDHQWCIGAVDTEIRARLAGPGSNVHVAGESYSDDQAWVNGALRSVDQMLEAHFGLGPLPPASL